MFFSVVLKNTLYQSLARIGSSGITFLTTLIIASYFGTTQFGEFTKIVTYVGLFYVFTDFGFNAVVLQRQEKQGFEKLLGLRILTGIGIVVVLNLIAFFLPYNPVSAVGFSNAVRFGILVFSFSVMAQAAWTSANALFQKQLSYQFSMIASIIGSAVSFVLVVLCVVLPLPFSSLLFALVGGQLVTAALALFFANIKVLPLLIDWRFSRHLIGESFPLGLMLLFNLIYFRIDIMVLSFFRSATEVGIYGYAYRFFDVIVALPLFLSNALYPILVSHGKNRKSLRSILPRFLLLFLGIGVSCVFVLWLVAPFIAFSNNEFSLSILPFRILLLSLPVFFLTSFFQWVLIAQKELRFLLWVYAGGACLSIVLTMIFVPLYGYIAAAVITGVAETCVLTALSVKLVLAWKKIMYE